MVADETLQHDPADLECAKLPESSKNDGADRHVGRSGGFVIRRVFKLLGTLVLMNVFVIGIGLTTGITGDIISTQGSYKFGVIIAAWILVNLIIAFAVHRHGTAPKTPFSCKKRAETPAVAFHDEHAVQVLDERPAKLFAAPGNARFQLEDEQESSEHSSSPSRPKVQIAAAEQRDEESESEEDDTEETEDTEETHEERGEPHRQPSPTQDRLAPAAAARTTPTQPLKAGLSRGNGPPSFLCCLLFRRIYIVD